MEGRYDSESEQVCMSAFYCGVLDVTTAKDMREIGCELPHDCLQGATQHRGFLNLSWLSWLGSSGLDQGETQPSLDGRPLWVAA